MVKKQKVIIFIIMGIFLFSIFQIGHTFASTETLSLKNVEIVNKSATVDVSNITYDNKTITNNITFHKVGDTVTYRITLKNNVRENYTIKSISDNNTNEFITYEYDSYANTKLNSNEEKTFNITVKYSNELTDMLKREQSSSVDFSFYFEDEKGNSKTEEITITPTTDTTTTTTTNKNEKKNSINNANYTISNQSDYIDTTMATSTLPKTGNTIIFYIALAIISFVMLMILFIRNYSKPNKTGKKLFSLFIAVVILLPTISKANSIILDISIQNLFKLHDKLVISREVNGETIYETINYGDTLSQPETPSKPGYKFKGWYLDDKTEFDFDTPITGDITINPHFEVITYDITYNLNGGTVSNPTTYTVDDEIRLNNPSKHGYTFSGWTGTGLTKKTENVIIDKGSTENRTYIACWTPINYSITYKGLTEDEKTALHNPTTYNIETESTTLKNPENRTDIDGDVVERFVGWKENQTISTNITIPAELENKVYEAMWVAVKPNIYTVTYNLNGGTVENENRISFTKSDTFTLSNPTRRGYTFMGWTGSNGTIPQTTVTVPVGTRENLNYTANWAEITYTITYNLNSGTVNPENPTTYTINSNNITLNNPIKTGYTFTGWTSADLAKKTLDVVIPTNSSGNRTYTANYDANKYTIIFDKNTGLGTMPNQVVTYDKSENLTTNTFTKTGYTFTGWNTKADGTGVSYTDGQNVKNLSSGENITLYAQWKLNIYFLDFHPNGGSGNQMERQRIIYGEETTITPNQYTNSPLLFAGWNTKEDGSGTYYADKQQIQNLTNINEQIIDLYAMWKELKVGDYIDYNPASGDGEGLIYKPANAPVGTGISSTFESNDITKWRIFNISDGKVTLVAEKPTVQTIELSGAYGYINGEKILNDIGNIYGHGIGAKKGRSISLNDIEPNFKYDKSTFKSVYNYGDTKTYKSGKFIVDNNIVTASASSPQTVTQTVHWYNINDYAYSIAENEVKNKIYNMLCIDIPITNRNNANPMYSPYWLASRTEFILSTSVTYGLHYIGDMHSTGTAEMGNRALFNSSETTYTVKCSVLPIVELKQSIKYTYNNTTEIWNIDYTPVNYTVTFNNNGGTGTMPDEEFELGEEKNLSKNIFQKEGYIFNGWNTETDGSGTYYSNEQQVINLVTQPNENIQLYAMWIDLEVGDYVSYNSGSGDGERLIYGSSNAPEGVTISSYFKSNGINKWRVFNISDGAITLVAEKPTLETVKLDGWNGLIHGVEALNDICDIYGHGIGATCGRCINLDDIEPYFKYDKTTFKSTFHNLENTIVYYGQEKEYNSGTFYKDGQLITASATNKQNEKQTIYWFNVRDYAYSGQDNKISNKIYSMLCQDIQLSNGNSDTNYTPYWIANRCVRLEHDCCQYYMHYMGDVNGTGNPEMGGQWLTTSTGSSRYAELNVLPLVTLDKSVIFELDENTDVWNINI